MRREGEGEKKKIVLPSIDKQEAKFGQQSRSLMVRERIYI
jgi:hypothetical protein